MRRLVPLFLIACIYPAALCAAGFPKTEPERAFAELKVYDAAGHPWRAAREDWDGAKQRVAHDPQWAAWLKRQRAEVDAWMTTHEDHVDWPAGWSHDGVSPKNGSRITWTDRVPGKDVQYFSSPSDPEIPITEKLFAWWVVSFRERHVGMMIQAARLYRITGDVHYAAWAAGQMDFYATNFARWKTLPTAKSKLFWQTLTEASNLIRYVDVVRLLGDYVTPEHRQQWRAQFFQPEVNLLNATHHDIHNIATWQRCAAAQVALLYGDQALWQQAIDGEWGLRRQLAEGITSDYLWYEQSLGYNAFVVSAVNTLFTTAGLYGRAAELAPEMSAAENLLIAPTYLRFPNGQLPNPADSGGIPTAPNREAFASCYRVFPTTIGLTDVAGQRDWDTLVDPPAPSPRPVVLPVVTSRNLESTRMAILKSGSWQIFIHYGQLTRSHIQAEALNYSAFYGDTDITHDPGTVGYGSPMYRGYYTRGLNHNVPLINGEGEVPPQRGELITYSAEPGTVAAAQPNYRDDARARRALHIAGNTLTDTATIESKKGPQKLGLALHLQGKVALPPSFVADSAFATGRPTSFGYWRNVTVATYRDRAEFDVDYHGTVMHVSLTAPGEFRLWHASTPDVAPKRRESFYLELAAPATTATFVTTWSPKA